MSKWISIRDKLPEKYSYVLTFKPGHVPVHCFAIKWVFSNVEKEIMSSKSRFYKITHWMPLPEPPKD